MIIKADEDGRKLIMQLQAAAMQAQAVSLHKTIELIPAPKPEGEKAEDDKGE